ncbi:helix-turn-helix transcriptional regulator [Zavarzinia compransoris]|nr:LuxR family transcriptional regulator [Zavarzinia compransoris]
MDDLLTMAERIEMVSTLSDAFDLIEGFARLHGFDHAACMELPRGTEVPDNALMIVRMPEAWVEHYIASDFALVDPVFVRAALDMRPFTWAEAARGARPEARRVMQEASAFRLNTGLTIPLHGPNGYRAEVTFAGERVTDDLRVFRQLRFLATTLHDRALTILGRGPGEGGPGLTPRERDCLHWVAAGKSDWAISQILGISETTVHWHVERAKRKFGASTRMQAIVTAIRLGLLTP